MAAGIRGVLPEDVAEMVSACRVLVVGAGGIGCELLKNLVLTGFQDIVLVIADSFIISNQQIDVVLLFIICPCLVCHAL